VALIDVILPADSVGVTDQAFGQIIPSLYDVALPADSVGALDQLLVELTQSVEIDDARALTATKVRIDFTKPMVADDALSDPANYDFQPFSGAASPVTPQSIQLPPGQTNPAFVEVVVSEHTDQEQYTVALSSNLTALDGAPADDDPFQYTGIGEAPTVLLVLAIDKNTVNVLFSEQLLDNPAVRDVARYLFDNGLVVTGVVTILGDTVTLRTTDQVEGFLYTLTILGADFLAISETDSVEVTDQLIVELINILANQVVKGSAEDIVVIGSGADIVIAGS
jgi:hypothetical protein